MAGTTFDRQLTTARPARVPFALATQADDADIRRMLRANPMPGHVTLTLEREPDYFADAGLPGTEKQTVIASECGRMVCMGSCAIRERFLNGQPCRVGYLGGLRLDAQTAGRFDILRRGYEFFRVLQAAKPADFYFTSIAADNVQAQKFLERGLPGMPTYEFVNEFVTVLLPIGGRQAIRNTLENDGITPSELLCGANEYGRDRQFAPRWSAEELSALQRLNLKTDDFCAVRDGGRICGSAALWDQRPFKQTVIRNYAPWLAITRPAANCAAHIMGTPRLPAPGSVLAHAFVSHLAAEPEKAGSFIRLIDKLRTLAAHRKIDFVTLGFAAADPRLTLLRRNFRYREYRSRIYVVRWPGLGGSARELGGRNPEPEVALL